MYMLYGYDEFLFKLYFAGIRQYMDYETGIVGIKRKISWLSLRETMRIEPQPGVKECLPDRNRVRRGVRTLERIGLLKNKSNGKRLIFECLLASRDNSAKSQVDLNPTHHSEQIADPIKQASNPINTVRAKRKTKQADPEADPHIPHQADPPPLSVNNKEKELLRSSKKKCRLPDDFAVTEQHVALARQNGWNDPHGEIDAFRDYHLARGNTFLDWDRAFYTWLRNGKKFQGGKQVGVNQSGGKTNSFNRAVENIINSANRSR